MYSLKDIYKLYKASIENFIEKDISVKVSPNEFEIIKKNLHKKIIKPVSKISKCNNVKSGQVYLFPEKYIIFVILDVEEYPYMVAIASQFTEFETNNSVILNGKDEQWLMLSIVRYVSDRIVEKSTCIDEISDSEMVKLYNLIFEDTKVYSENVYPLPTELHYEFEKNELERTRWMMGSIFDDE